MNQSRALTIPSVFCHGFGRIPSAAIAEASASHFCQSSNEPMFVVRVMLFTSARVSKTAAAICGLSNRYTPIFRGFKQFDWAGSV